MWLPSRTRWFVIDVMVQALISFVSRFRFRPIMILRPIDSNSCRRPFPLSFVRSKSPGPSRVRSVRADWLWWSTPSVCRALGVGRSLLLYEA